MSEALESAIVQFVLHTIILTGVYFGLYRKRRLIREIAQSGRVEAYSQTYRGKPYPEENIVLTRNQRRMLMLQYRGIGIGFWILLVVFVTRLVVMIAIATDPI